MLNIPESLREKIYSLKERYHYVYLLDVTSIRLSEDELTPGYLVIRPLTRREFNFYCTESYLEPEKTTEQLVERCVVWPHNFRINNPDYKYSFGIDSFLTRAIVNVSAFASENILLEGVEYSRTYARTMEAIITMMICRAFPRYTPEDVDNMPFHEQIKLVGMSEQMTGYEVPYMEILHPELIPKKQEKADKQKIQEAVNRATVRRRVAEGRGELPPPPKGWASEGPGASKAPDKPAPTLEQRGKSVGKSEMFKHQQELRDFLGNG
jgi:hypothetical protein